MEDPVIVAFLPRNPDVVAGETVPAVAPDGEDVVQLVIGPLALVVLKPVGKRTLSRSKRLPAWPAVSSRR
jgi:hypothetical protein